MEKSFEHALPEGYRKACHIDAGSKKTVALMSLAALAVMIISMIICFILIHPLSFTFSFPPLLVTLAVIIAYVFGHELVHGAAYKLLTGQKLTYGFSLSVAYCGVPDIYVYRKTALISMLAPFAVFSVVFIAGMILIPGDYYKILCAFVFSAHFGGCVGDLFGVILFLFRFRSPDSLMRDTGPAQTFYVKE